ncbi:phycocyanobilin lyase alpha subunit [Dorcoceras hygrometricum]|uniref:Phycocyanobilin lyase alpha subunit n=1 Tax=Dorcoceras hygrometricum TaxID=472368 RepID=A0A2Z6ZX16_9LAMI|nr:phycocyanobilin lyase alpha subunit [Dorcoceras hygrometricum]
MESAVMTSVVMSSQSAVGNQRMKRSARETTASWNQQRFALTLKIRQMLFALKPVVRYQQVACTSRRELQRYIQPVVEKSSRKMMYQSRASVLYISSRHGFPDARKAEVAKRCNQAQSIQSTKISAED